MVFCCYLLTPTAFKRKIATYVGYTVNPDRRLRQHNGEITGGAEPTEELRPWDMVCVVHGFRYAHDALSFEWALHHPLSDERTKERLGELVGKPGYGSPFSVRRRLVEIFEMLRLYPWHTMKLTVPFTSEEYHEWGRDLGVYYQWSENKKCDTKSLGVWKVQAKKENRAKRLRAKKAKAALLALAKRRLRKLAVARRRRVRLAELEVEVLELRATNLDLRLKRSRDDDAPDSLSKRQCIEPPDTTDSVRESRVVVDEPVAANPTASSPSSMACELSLVPDATLNSSSGTGDRRRDSLEPASEEGRQASARRQLLWSDSLLDAMLSMRSTDPMIVSAIASAASNKQKSAAWALFAARLSETESMRFSERQLRAKFAKVKWEYKHWRDVDNDRQPSYINLLRRWFAG